MLDLKNDINRIPGNVFCKNRYSEYIACNRHYTEFTGLTVPEAVIGKTDLDFQWSCYADHYREGDELILNGTSLLNRVEMILLPNDKHASILVSKTPLLDDHANIIGIMGSFVEITKSTLEHYQDLRIQNNPILTQREKAIVKYLVKGKTSKTIAEILSLSRRTVEKHLENIKMKFGATSKSELIEIICNKVG